MSFSFLFFFRNNIFSRKIIQIILDTSRAWRTTLRFVVPVRIPRLQSARLNSQRVHFCTLEPAFASSTTIYLRFIDTVSETRLLLYRLHCSSSLAVSSRLNLKKICGYPARSTRRVISFKIYIYIFFAIYSIKYLNSTLEYQSYMQIIQYNIVQ